MCSLDSDKRDDISGRQDTHAAGPWDTWGIAQKNKWENIKAVQGKENGFMILKEIIFGFDTACGVGESSIIIYPGQQQWQGAREDNLKF